MQRGVNVIGKQTPSFRLRRRKAGQVGEGGGGECLRLGQDVSYHLHLIKDMKHTDFFTSYIQTQK